MIVEVAVLPIAAIAVERKVCVMVDALRASATMVAMLDAGAAEITLASSVDDARQMAAADRANTWLAGEVGGLPPEDFDLGNSPTEILATPLGTRRIIYATSNGTRALAHVAHSPCVLVGSLVNASAVAQYARAQAVTRGLGLCIVCAGDEGGTLLSLEDLVSAGVLVELLLASIPTQVWPEDEGSETPNVIALDEAAKAALRVYRSYLPPGAPPLPPNPEALDAAFKDARHGRDLLRINFPLDFVHCQRADSSHRVPLLARRGERLVVVPAPFR